MGIGDWIEDFLQTNVTQPLTQKFKMIGDGQTMYIEVTQPSVTIIYRHARVVTLIPHILRFLPLERHHTHAIHTLDVSSSVYIIKRNIYNCFFTYKRKRKFTLYEIIPLSNFSYKIRN